MKHLRSGHLRGETSFAVYISSGPPFGGGLRNVHAYHDKRRGRLADRTTRGPHRLVLPRRLLPRCGARCGANIMNRHERRAAQAAAKNRPVDRTIAVHEAGHAMGRYLIAAKLGHGPNTAISYIDVHAAPVSSGRVSLDGVMDMRSQAVTHSAGLDQECRRASRPSLPHGHRPRRCNRSTPDRMACRGI